jgi:hypothetical protein
MGGFVYFYSALCALSHALGRVAVILNEKRPDLAEIRAFSS